MRAPLHVDVILLPCAFAMIAKEKKSNKQAPEDHRDRSCLAPGIQTTGPKQDCSPPSFFHGVTSMDIATRNWCRTKSCLRDEAFAVLNKVRKLVKDKYRQAGLSDPHRLRAGKTKRLVVSMPPRHCNTLCPRSVYRRGVWHTIPSAKILIRPYGQTSPTRSLTPSAPPPEGDWFQQSCRDTTC